MWPRLRALLTSRPNFPFASQIQRAGELTAENYGTAVVKTGESMVCMKISGTNGNTKHKGEISIDSLKSGLIGKPARG